MHADKHNDLWQRSTDVIVELQTINAALKCLS